MSPRSPLKLVRIWQGRGGTVRKRKKERRKERKKERKKYYVWVGKKDWNKALPSRRYHRMPVYYVLILIANNK